MCICTHTTSVALRKPHFFLKSHFVEQQGEWEHKAPLLISRRRKRGIITTYWKGPQANKVSNTIITVVTAHIRAKVILRHGWWASRTHHAVIACRVLSLSVMFTGMLRLPQLCLMRERLTNSFAQGQTKLQLRCVYKIEGKCNLINSKSSVVRREEIIFCLHCFAYSSSVQPT